MRQLSLLYLDREVNLREYKTARFPGVEQTALCAMVVGLRENVDNLPKDKLQ